MHDLAGTDLPLTQEFLAQMMGVRRTSVTIVAGELQKAGMITYSRGHIHLLDLDMIGPWACECENDVRCTIAVSFILTRLTHSALSVLDIAPAYHVCFHENRHSSGVVGMSYKCQRRHPDALD